MLHEYGLAQIAANVLYEQMIYFEINIGTSLIQIIPLDDHATTAPKKLFSRMSHYESRAHSQVNVNASLLTANGHVNALQ